MIAAAEMSRADGSRSAARRVLAALVLLLMVVGAFVLWIGVPAAVLWGVGKVTSDLTEHLILGLLAVPIAMIAFGLLLTQLNYAYLRLSGFPAARPDDEDGWRPTLRGPLDHVIRVSAIICLVAFLGWLIFGSAGVAPVGP